MPEQFVDAPLDRCERDRLLRSIGALEHMPGKQVDRVTHEHASSIAQLKPSLYDFADTLVFVGPGS